MRETNAHGHEVIFMPREASGTINKLATLGAAAAKRDWERAALVAMHVKPAGRGRPKTGNSSGYKQDNLAEFTRRGIYGLTSEHAIRAWLKAWQSSGLPVPVPGSKVELPNTDFPELGQFYPGKQPEADDGSQSTLDGITDEEADDYTEDEPAGQNEPSPRSQSHPRPEFTMLDKFLQMLDHIDPALVLHGQPADKRQIFIKTMESWLDSLREAAKDDE